ncbi:hypothetical protein D3C87_1780280 [compost metagenome]
MLLGGNDLGDDERLEGGLVIDVLDLEPDHRQARADRFQRSVGFKVVLEPGKREFHDFTCVLIFRDQAERPPNKVGMSSGRKP